MANLQVVVAVDRRPRRRKALTAWWQDQGDLRFRLDYNLSPESTVLDVGGFLGQWTSDIYSRFLCRVLVFEPVWRYASFIRSRFRANPAITVFPFGLADRNVSLPIWVRGDSSSVFAPNPAAVREVARFVDVVEMLSRLKIQRVHLAGVNIEGGEYDLLSRLIDGGVVGRFDNLQVQFHDFTPMAVERRVELRKRLRRTHYLTYDYPFVWENWRLKGL